MRDAWLADGIQIRLPGMIIKHAGEKANSLDLWLQRGRLISAFRPDQGFLRVHVNLLAELPAGDLERAVQTIGFEVPRRQRLSITYVHIRDRDDEGDDANSQWRSRLDRKSTRRNSSHKCATRMPYYA